MKAIPWEPVASHVGIPVQVTGVPRQIKRPATNVTGPFAEVDTKNP
jgi:hypothetical protein